MKYTKDYYQILGVELNATSVEIRRAYHRLAILYHPDRNPTPQSNIRMQEINEAYGVIGEHNKRAEYDFQRLNIFTQSTTTNSRSYNQKGTFSRPQDPVFWRGILFSGFLTFLIATMIFVRAKTIFAGQHTETPMLVAEDVLFFGEEAAFIANNSTIGPVDAPLSATSNVINIETYGLTIKPGANASAIAVGNVIDNSLPSDLSVVGLSYSNLTFEFVNNITGFGFAVESSTAEEYRGVSNFVVTLQQGNREVGTISFSTPSEGVIFVAFVSKTPFNTIVLVEVDGGPENQDQLGGFADRESFGKFYIVP